MATKGKTRGDGGTSGAGIDLLCGRSNGRGLRTFHLLLSPITCAAGGANRGRRALVYMDRLEAFSARDDLVGVVGREREEMVHVIEALDAAAHGRDRVVIGGHLELDARLPDLDNLRTLAAIAEMIEEDGFPCHAAMHRSPQPHGHLAVGARPVHQTEDGWAADPPGRRGRPAKNFVPGKPAMRSLRERVAAIVNGALDRQGIAGDRWHPGGFREIGIERVPKARVPLQQFYRQKQADSMAQDANSRIDRGEGEVVATERQEWGSRRRKAAAEKRVAKRQQSDSKALAKGYVPIERLKDAVARGVEGVARAAADARHERERADAVEHDESGHRHRISLLEVELRKERSGRLSTERRLAAAEAERDDFARREADAVARAEMAERELALKDRLIARLQQELAKAQERLHRLGAWAFDRYVRLRQRLQNSEGRVQELEQRLASGAGGSAGGQRVKPTALEAEILAAPAPAPAVVEGDAKTKAAYDSQRAAAEEMARRAAAAKPVVPTVVFPPLPPEPTRPPIQPVRAKPEQGATRGDRRDQNPIER